MEQDNEINREHYRVVSGTETAEIDSLDYSLLNELAINARCPLINLADKLDCSSQSINYRLKNLLKKDIIKEGNDVCLIGTGFGSILALKAANSVEKSLNISIKVINFPTIKPIDKKSLLKEIKSVKGIVVIEEHNIYCGIGSILARIISSESPIPMKFIGIDNSFGQSGKREKLLDFYGLNQENILKQVNNLIKNH